jgi:hypothetical protein
MMPDETFNESPAAISSPLLPGFQNSFLCISYPDRGQILHAAQALHLHQRASHGIGPGVAPLPVA